MFSRDDEHLDEHTTICKVTSAEDVRAHFDERFKTNQPLYLFNQQFNRPWLFSGFGSYRGVEKLEGTNNIGGVAVKHGIREEEYFRATVESPIRLATSERHRGIIVIHETLKPESVVAYVAQDRYRCD